MNTIAIRGMVFMATQFLGQGIVQGLVSDPLLKSILTFLIAGLGVLIAYLDKTVANGNAKHDPT